MILSGFSKRRRLSNGQREAFLVEQDNSASDRAIRLRQQDYRLSPSFKAVPSVRLDLLDMCCLDAQPPRSGKLEAEHKVRSLDYVKLLRSWRHRFRHCYEVATTA